MLTRLKNACGGESGFALPFALGIMMVLGILSIAVATFVTANSEHAQNSKSGVQALQYAEAGLNGAYSIIWNANNAGQDPTTAGLVGTVASPKVFCVDAGGSACAAGKPGTASTYGCYGGTNGSTCNGIAVPASTWLIVSTGYALGPSAGAATPARSMEAHVSISPNNTPNAVASVWNHIFMTAPLVPNVCQTTFSMNNLVIDAPIYAIGNVCLIGNNDFIEEVGQPVDLMVGGKLVLSGPNSRVGADSTHPITSGVVVGGCNTTGVTYATSPCGSGGFNYWVKNPESFISQDAPTFSTEEIEADYLNADPGPNHACAGNTSPPGLNPNQFDSSVAAGEGTTSLPDNSGSGSSGGTFNLTPNSSYACISQSGTDKGYIIWNNDGGNSLTVGGVTVPPKTLAVKGTSFFDSNVSLTQTAVYSGTAMILIAGQYLFNTNNTTLCAVSGCGTNWQGSSGNNSMLTLATVCSPSNGCSSPSSAFLFSANSNTFQGSAYTLPSDGVTFTGNTTTLMGPMSIGTMNVVFNNPKLLPLPVIKNMPVGAPLPPNIGVTLSSLTIVK
jgi:Tfp pilus assembly protein PilX